ncbi:MAG: hypothetical protein AAF933_12325, partial [Pseudomonadota bacterium]
VDGDTIHHRALILMDGDSLWTDPFPTLVRAPQRIRLPWHWGIRLGAQAQHCCGGKFSVGGGVDDADPVLSCRAVESFGYGNREALLLRGLVLEGDDLDAVAAFRTILLDDRVREARSGDNVAAALVDEDDEASPGLEGTA